MRPLLPLSVLFVAPVSTAGQDRTFFGFSTGETTSTTTSRLRALAIAKSYLQALLVPAGKTHGKDQELIRTALTDMSFILPHVLALLEHPQRAVREASMAVLSTVNDASGLPLRNLELQCNQIPIQAGDDNSTVEIIDRYPSINALDLSLIHI